jgi:hypothetical protein
MAANQLSQRPGIEVAILWMVKVGRNRQGGEDQPKVKEESLELCQKFSFRPKCILGTN